MFIQGNHQALLGPLLLKKPLNLRLNKSLNLQKKSGGQSSNGRYLSTMKKHQCRQQMLTPPNKERGPQMMNQSIKK